MPQKNRFLLFEGGIQRSLSFLDVDARVYIHFVEIHNDKHL